MTVSKRHGIKDLTKFAMEVIRRSGKEALTFTIAETFFLGSTINS